MGDKFAEFLSPEWQEQRDQFARGLGAVILSDEDDEVLRFALLQSPPQIHPDGFREAIRALRERISASHEVLADIVPMTAENFEPRQLVVEALSDCGILIAYLDDLLAPYGRPDSYGLKLVKRGAGAPIDIETVRKGFQAGAVSQHFLDSRKAKNAIEADGMAAKSLGETDAYVKKWRLERAKVIRKMKRSPNSKD